MKQSKLILVDGISGSGKDTQMGFIERFFSEHGYRVHTVHEPSDFLGDFCRAYRNRSLEARDGWVEAMLFAADRRQHYLDRVRPLLEEQGNAVISNRSFVSSAAYQSLQGVPLDEILRLNEFYPEPDLALVFLCEPQEAVRRIHQRAQETGKPVSAQENLERITAIRG
ncbi:dTMP kinase, partial [Candidatus Uhrbacteria bacterium]|nr:dTMP kinase [Candidatus Uhrbacteria bacterium]